ELAESWSNSPDGKTWTFNLRQDVYFHSGNHMTAEDVIWSFKRLMSLDFAPTWIVRELGLTQEGIKKLDEYTVSLTFDTPYAGFLVMSRLAFTVGSIIDSKEAMAHEQKTEEFPKGDWGHNWLEDHSAGTGPFKLEQWIRLDEIVLVRNDNWWMVTPGMQKIVIKEISEPKVQMIALTEGDIDIAMDLLTEQVNELRGMPGIRIESTSTFRVTYLGMNMYNFEPFQNEKVRDAIRWAIDYEEFTLGGGVNVGQTFVPEGMLAHNPAKPYTHNVDKAKALLKEAGYPNGFEVELLCANYFPWTEIAVKLQDDLAEVGIRVTITFMLTGEMYQIYRQQNHEIVLASWGADYPDPDALAKPFAHCETNGQGAAVRLLAWRNMAEHPELAAMVDAAAREQDRTTRIAMYMKIQDIVLDWGPFAILYYPLEQHGVRTEVKDFNVRPMFYKGELWQIYKIRPTNTAPTVCIIRPNGGECISGTYEIHYVAEDPDGDLLTFTISYSPNGGQTWTQVASGVRETSYRWDTSAVEAGANYLVKVEAMDGIHTTVDTSDATFTVELESPPETSQDTIFIPSFQVGEALGALLVIGGLGLRKRRSF
ncbi:MAG: ABC transporter substrate-binding protein, partial [Candidatus Hodarchaeota archaeon]